MPQPVFIAELLIPVVEWTTKIPPPPLAAQFTVPPLSSCEVSVEYTPCSLSHLDECVVTVDGGTDVPATEYRVTGRGVPPSPADCTTLRAAPGELGQASVTWRNPFAEPVEAVVSLSASSSSPAGVLELLLDPGQQRQMVGPLATVQLPVSFRPSTAEAEASGEILVLVAHPPGLAEAITWKLPVRGVVEAKQPQQQQQLQQQPVGETEAGDVGGDAASASASASASAPSAFKFRCKALTRMEQVS